MADYADLRKIVEEKANTIDNEKVRKMYLNCFFSTLDTTTEILEDGTTYVFTGDIPAMWLRDSSVQVSGYLNYVEKDKSIKSLIKGLIKRQFMYIQHDPYSNAFNKTVNGEGHGDDVTDFYSPLVWERKFEIDSLCYPFWLVEKYYTKTNDDSIYDSEYLKTANIIVDLFIREQNHFEDSKYRHQRPKYPEFPTLSNQGVGNNVAYTGLIWSGYRPSDDVCDYNYLIPANMFAVVILKDILKVLKRNKITDENLFKKTEKLLKDVESGLSKYAIVEHENFGKIFAYELDGLGGYNFMDDANVPSLLSLPYLGYCDKNDQVYLNTRKFVLSHSNPYYFEGKVAKGIGSPHTPANHIWPISLAMQLLTSADEKEQRECFEMLTNTDAGCGVVHESFHKDDPAIFTREWFCWANTLYAMCVEKIYFQHN